MNFDSSLLQIYFQKIGFVYAISVKLRIFKYNTFFRKKNLLKAMNMRI